MRKLFSTTVALALCLASTTPSADEMLFEQLDADADGQISRDEFLNFSEQIYRDATEEPDDKLFTRDYQEQRVHRDDEPVGTVNLDTNQDDYVSMEEAQADWETSFGSLDENDDGMINADEWSSLGYGIPVGGKDPCVEYPGLPHCDP